MKKFYYKATDKNKNPVSGELLAINQRFAFVELENQSLKNIRFYYFFKLPRFKKTKTKQKEITLFFQHLSVLIGAGIPLLSCLDLMEKNTEHPPMNAMIQKIKLSITSGHNLSDSLAAYPKQFNPFILHLVQLGESTGSLDIVLKKIVGYLEKIQSIKKRIIKALIYPIAIIIVAILIVIIMLIFVIPEFQLIFNNHNTPLPLATRLVIYLSNFVRAYGLVFLLFLIFTVKLFFIAKQKNKTFQLFLDRLVLKIPIFKTAVHHSILARIMHSLAIATQSGTSLLSAITFSGKIANNQLFNRALKETYQRLNEGQSLCESLSDKALFPSFARNMIKIGEDSGKLDMILEKIATHYQESVDFFIDQLSELIEPLIMVVLGIIIGGLVIAMYLPIFKLGSVIG